MDDEQARAHGASELPTGTIGSRRACTLSMISALSIPCRYMLVMPRLVWPSWLDRQQRHALAGHFDGLPMPELMGCEASTDAGVRGSPTELGLALRRWTTLVHGSGR
jgi:hypothetical protein